MLDENMITPDDSGWPQDDWGRKALSSQKIGDKIMNDGIVVVYWMFVFAILIGVLLFLIWLKRQVDKYA